MSQPSSTSMRWIHTPSHPYYTTETMREHPRRYGTESRRRRRGGTDRRRRRDDIYRRRRRTRRRRTY
jgi:hypothetical protein